MASRLSGQTSIFGVVFFVSKSHLGIEGQRKLEKFAILTRKPRSRARILIYRTWPIAKLLSNLNVKRTAGPDQIPCWVLKNAAQEIAPFLQRFFSLSLQIGLACTSLQPLF